MITKNPKSDLILQEQSVFELWEKTSAEKRIMLKNSVPLRYSALVYASELDFSLETAQEGSVLDMMLLCPVMDEKPLHINLHLDLKHHHCKIALHLVALVQTDAKTTLNATIMMEPHIQDASAHLLEETVILSPEVQLKSLPILDIHAKNIQASHGAKIYRLDEEKLFYLQSKGLSFKQAQQLLLSSYVEKLFADLELEEEEKQALISDFFTF
jgi:sufD protein